MPDGILPLEQAAIYLTISILIIGIAVWQSKKKLSMKQIPIIGVLAAGLFAAQMFNFPAIGGTSGHLIGTALATVLVGPWVAILILSSVLIVQAMFGDGGFLAYGANVLNMAIIGAIITIALFYLLPSKWRDNKTAYSIFAGITGFISTVIMAFAASVELVLAKAGSPAIIFTSMLTAHAFIGAMEAVITFTVVFFLFKVDTSIFQTAKTVTYGEIQVDELKPQFKFPLWAVVTSVGIFVLMSVLGFVLPLVGGDNPDGLEATIEQIWVHGSDYTTPIFNFPEGFGWEILQMAILMVILFVFLVTVSYLIYRLRVFQFNRHHGTAELILEEEKS